MATHPSPVNRPKGLKFVTGKAPSVRGAHLGMALRATSHARALGLKVETVKPSRDRLSKAHYLILIDEHKRKWAIRIADHHHPRRCRVAHIDLVSLDGVAGEGWLLDCLSAIAVDGLPWFNNQDTEMPDRAKRQPRQRTYRPGAPR